MGYLGTDFFELTWTNDINKGIIAYNMLLSDTDGEVVEVLTPGTQYMVVMNSLISTNVDFATLNVVTSKQEIYFCWTGIRIV